MKHYFFINPAAGKGKLVDKLTKEIDRAAKELGAEYQILYTDAVGDGERKARELAEKLGESKGRFYACGGDGTANEITNGIADVPGAALGIIPIGTGNDTVRNFPDAGNFMDIRSQILGDTKPVDLLKYTGFIDGRHVSAYCINMINIGFDCNVVELTGRLKQKPFIQGSSAYLLGVAGMLIKKKGASLSIFDGETKVREGDILLSAICNGSYCGGGVNSTPQAAVDDGFMDLLIIEMLPRHKFIKMFPSYKNGTYYGDPTFDRIIETRKSKEITIKPYGTKDMFICVDGEIRISEGIKVEMCHKAIDFIIPARDSINQQGI